MGAEEMACKRRAMHYWTILVTVLAVQATAAATVYRSIDENGVIVFSDTPPEQREEVEILEIETPATAQDGLLTERLQALREATDRLASDRRAREKHRAELRRMQRDMTPTSAYSPVPREDAEYRNMYLPYYTGRAAAHRNSHYDGPLRHPRVKHRHPSASGFNEYPASLIRKKYDPRAREAFSQ